MKIPYFIWVYKVRSALPDWKGWRYNVYYLYLFEECDFWEAYEAGEFDFDPWTPEEMEEYGVTEEEVREMEESPYPLCYPETQCKCCKLGREGKKRHRHSGFGMSSIPIHLPS